MGTHPSEQIVKGYQYSVAAYTSPKRSESRPSVAGKYYQKKAQELLSVGNCTFASFLHALVLSALSQCES